MEKLMQKLQTIEGGDILDIGSGRGEFIHIIKEFKSFEKITANDIEDRSEELIKEQFIDLNIEFVKANAANLPFEDECFDTVCLSNSLHHLPDLEAILIEMKRVLRKNGNFIINEMYRDDQSDAQLSHVLIHHWFAKIDRLEGRHHAKTFTKNEIKTLLEDIELTKLEIIDYTWPVTDVKDENMIKERTKLIDMGLKKLAGKDDLKAFKEEGEKIRAHIQQHGFAPASSLFVLGKK